MIKYKNVFNNNTLNIFTDASVYKNGNEIIGAPGMIAVFGNNCEEFIDMRILRNSTNNESELYAVYLAIQYALKCKKDFEVINIFSDSQFAIFGLREWIFNWVNGIKQDRLYNSSHKLVANQQLFMNIIYTILLNDLEINLYHNRGHFKPSQIKSFIELFTKHNFLNDFIDRETALAIMKYNDKIDNYTRATLKNMDINQYPELQLPDYLARADIDLDYYKKLLNI